MDFFIINKEKKKLDDLKIKDFRLENIYSISDVKTRMDFSLKKSDSKITNKKFFEKPDSVVEEVQFNANVNSNANDEIMKFFGKCQPLVLDKQKSFNSNLSFDNKLFRMDSTISYDNPVHMMKNSLSRNFSNNSGFFGTNKYNF